MYPSIPSNEAGVLIDDRKFKIGNEIRQALKERKIVLLKFRKRRGPPCKKTQPTSQAPPHSPSQAT
jgi:hypothetical protein